MRDPRIRKHIVVRRLKFSITLRDCLSFAIALTIAGTGLSACRLGANNSEKLTALQSGEIYDEEGLVSVSILAPAADTLINVASDSSTFAASGTCSPDGAPVTLLIDEVAVATSEVVCSQGVWSTHFDSTALTNATHSLTASVATSGNMKLSEAVAIRKDASLPALAILSPSQNSFINATTNSATFALSGTCTESGQDVSVTVDGTSASAQSGGSCNGATWAATISTLPLSAGAHTFQVSIVSANGNSKASDPVVVTKDVTAPTAAITTPSNASFVNIGNNSASFAVSGTCNDATASVQVKVDGTNSGSAAACGGTNWNSTISTVALAQGAHTLSAQISDAAGNSATTSSISITKDTVAPTIAVGSPSSGAYVNLGNNSATFAASGTCSGASENGQSVTLKVNGSNATQSAITCGAGSTWSGTFSTAALSEATHTLSATLSDAAGNSTTSTTVSLIKDTQAPTVAITSPLSSIYINPVTNSATYAVTGTCTENSSTVSIQVDGATASGLASNSCTSGAFSATIDTTVLSNAVHTITAMQTDAAGNTGSLTPSSVTVTKNDALPMGGTMSRTSVAYDPYTGAQAASGIARYSTVASATGVMVEEGTTNLAGSSGSFETDSNSDGIADNVGYYTTFQSSSLVTDSMFGSKAQKGVANGSTAAPRFYHNVNTTPGTQYTYSIWCKGTPGASMVLDVKTRNASTAEVSSPVATYLTATSSYQRLVATYTPVTDGNAVTTFVAFGLRNTPAAGTEVICDGLQVEAKAYATTWTDGTREPETYSLPTAGNIAPSQGAIVIRAYVDGDTALATPQNTHYLFDTGDSYTSNRIRLYRGTGALAATVTNSSGTNATASLSAAQTTGWHIFGMKWSSAGVALYLDGSLVGSTASFSAPSSLPALGSIGTDRIGANPTHWNKPIDYAAFYQRAPSDSEMQTFTNTGPTGADNRLDFNGGSFSRGSVAYDPFTGAQTASGSPRFATSGTGTGVVIESYTQNLLTNPSFESALSTGWASNPVSLSSASIVDTGVALFGTNSVRIDGGSAHNWTGRGQSYASVVTGTKYTFSGWIKCTPGVDAAASYPAYIRLYKSSDGGTTKTLVQDVTSKSSTWKRLEINYTAEAGVNYLITEFFASQGIPAGNSCWFDGMQLEARTNASTFISGSRASEVLSYPKGTSLDASAGKIRARIMSLRPAGTSLQTIVDAGGTSGTTGHIFYLTMGGLLNLQVSNGTGNSNAVSTTVIAPNVWYTVEGEWGASGLTVKVNGTTESNTPMTPAPTLNSTVYIGTNQGVDRWFDGIIDWVELENAAGTVTRYEFNGSMGN